MPFANQFTPCNYETKGIACAALNVLLALPETELQAITTTGNYYTVTGATTGDIPASHLGPLIQTAIHLQAAGITQWPMRADDSDSRVTQTASGDQQSNVQTTSELGAPSSGQLLTVELREMRKTNAFPTYTGDYLDWYRRVTLHLLDLNILTSAEEDPVTGAPKIAVHPQLTQKAEASTVTSILNNAFPINGKETSGSPASTKNADYLRSINSLFADKKSLQGLFQIIYQVVRAREAGPVAWRTLIWEHFLRYFTCPPSNLTLAKLKEHLKAPVPILPYLSGVQYYNLLRLTVLCHFDTEFCARVRENNFTMEPQEFGELLGSRIKFDTYFQGQLCKSSSAPSLQGFTARMASFQPKPTAPAHQQFYSNHGKRPREENSCELCTEYIQKYNTVVAFMHTRHPTSRCYAVGRHQFDPTNPEAPRHRKTRSGRWEGKPTAEELSQLRTT